MMKDDLVAGGNTGWARYDGSDTSEVHEVCDAADVRGGARGDHAV